MTCGTRGFKPAPLLGAALLVFGSTASAFRPQAIGLEAVEAAGQRDPVLNPGRTGAATFIDPEKVALLPSVKRSTRDLIRVDPRNDGNYSFAGRNWLYNNISLDGSYFNNPFGL